MVPVLYPDSNNTSVAFIWLLKYDHLVPGSEEGGNVVSLMIVKLWILTQVILGGLLKENAMSSQHK